MGAWRSGHAQQQLVVPSSNFRIHDAWNPSNEEYDIALMRLPRPADIKQSGIDIGRLPRKADRSQSFSGKTSTVVGWGYTGKTDEGQSEVPYPRRGEDPVEYLHAADAEIITNAACLLRYPAYIHTSNICTR